MNAVLPMLRRDLDIIPVQHQGQQLFAIRDNLGLIEDPIAVNRGTLGLLGLLDGQRTLGDLQLILTRQNGGVIVPREDVERIIGQFDEALLLDSDRYRQARQGLVDEFERSPLRQAVLAGQSYPADATELRHYLSGLVSGGQGVKERVVALVAPHIDVATGAKGYAAAYSALAGQVPERVVVLGTGHSLEEGMFCLTEKDFETPLGRIRTDKPAVRRLAEVGQVCVAKSAFAHRREHSIEIQLVFLQHVLGRSDFGLVPILCGSIHSHLQGGTRIGQLPGEREFLAVLKEWVAAPGTLTVAGVDLSHIGHKFGDPQPASVLAEEARRQDKRLVDALCARDTDGFWRTIQATNDRYHVCGASSLAALLALLPPCRGRVLCYDLWHEDATQSAVSYASVLYEE